MIAVTFPNIHQMIGNLKLLIENIICRSPLIENFPESLIMILTVHFLRPIANLSNETSAVEVEIESSEFLLYRRVPQNCTQNKTKNLDIYQIH